MSKRSPVVYVCGDSMLDVSVTRPHYRLDQETGTVPVLQYPPGGGASNAPGGAANVALNLSRLGCATTLYSNVTPDRVGGGRDLIESLVDAGVGLVSDASGCDGTTVKTRYYDGRGRLVGRVDADHQSLRVNPPPGADRPDAIILTDYGRGALDREAITAWIGRWPGVPVYGDPKAGRCDMWKELPDLDTFVLNRAEAEDFPGPTGPINVVRRVFAAVRADRIVLKLGAEGSVLWDSGGGSGNRSGSSIVDPDAAGYRTVSRIDPKGNCGVLDVQGAGDTYVAAMAAARCRGASVYDSCLYASAAAGTAVHMRGTAAPTAAEVAATIRDHVCGRRGVLNAVQAADLSARLKACGLAVGYTNGCFDLRPTAGHLHVIGESARRCDFLFVGVDSDRRVRTLKGPSRPIVPEAERAAAVAALSGVGAAFVFGTEPADVVRLLAPDRLFKGGDYAAATMPELPALAEVGGEFVHVGAVPCPSTTEFLGRLTGR